MLQREIWHADLSPVIGSEQRGYRTVVIISGNVVNTYLDVIIACPLTTKIKNYKGNVILEPDKLNGLKKKSEIITFQISSISKSRLVKRIGSIKEKELQIIKQSLDDILRY